MTRAWYSRKRVWAILLAVLIGWAAYWPIPRLELSDPRHQHALYLALPSSRTFKIFYQDTRGNRSEIRKFFIGKDDKIRFLEAIYLHPSPRLVKLFDPKDVSRQGDALIVREHVRPVPAVHIVVTPEKKRVLWLGKNRRKDLGTIFPPGTVVTIRVARKALLFFLWNRYVTR